MPTPYRINTRVDTSAPRPDLPPLLAQDADRLLADLREIFEKTQRIPAWWTRQVESRYANECAHLAEKARTIPKLGYASIFGIVWLAWLLAAPALASLLSSPDIREAVYILGLGSLLPALVSGAVMTERGLRASNAFATVTIPQLAIYRGAHEIAARILWIRSGRAWRSETWSAEAAFNEQEVAMTALVSRRAERIRQMKEVAARYDEEAKQAEHRLRIGGGTIPDADRIDRLFLGRLAGRRTRLSAAIKTAETGLTTATLLGQQYATIALDNRRPPAAS